MENSKETELKIRQVVEKFVLLKQGFTEVKGKYDSIIAKYRDEVRELKDELDKRAVELEDFEKYNLPKVFIMEIENKKLKKKYLKAVVRYYVQGVRKQKATTVHLGQLSDFPDGINDLRLLELANYKAMEFVQRKKLEESKYNNW